MFFKGGGDFITDALLLIIAGIFMHWSLRVPWNWYHSAQAVVGEPRDSPPSTPVVEDEDGSILSPIQTNDDKLSTASATKPNTGTNASKRDHMAAETELRLHELAALLCCFVSPALSAWLLHAIRAHLSRPSEGLVSNFNISIFLMFAEIKPMSHLIKLILRRTLFLQRRVNLDNLRDQSHPAGEKLNDLIARIEELEAHVANGIASKDSQSDQSLDQAATKASALALAETRKLMQPELEALARAMRRYEKKTTVAAVQNEGRLQQLEAKYADVVVLAASAQRSVQSQPRQYSLIVLNWLCAGIVIPVEMAQSVLYVPQKMYRQTIKMLAGIIPGMSRSKKSKDPRSQRRAGKDKIERRVKGPP